MNGTHRETGNPTADRVGAGEEKGGEWEGESGMRREDAGIWGRGAWVWHWGQEASEGWE